MSKSKRKSSKTVSKETSTISFKKRSNGTIDKFNDDVFAGNFWPNDETNSDSIAYDAWLAVEVETPYSDVESLEDVRQSKLDALVILRDTCLSSKVSVEVADNSFSVASSDLQNLASRVARLSSDNAAEQAEWSSSTGERVSLNVEGFASLLLKAQIALDEKDERAYTQYSAIKKSLEDSAITTTAELDEIELNIS